MYLYKVNRGLCWSTSIRLYIKLSLSKHSKKHWYTMGWKEGSVSDNRLKKLSN